MSTVRTPGAAVGALVLAGALLGVGALATASPDGPLNGATATSMAVAPAPPRPADTDAVLDALAARQAPALPRGKEHGYDRDAYDGGGWPSWQGHPGCDVRDRTLVEDLDRVTYAPGSTCDVTGGALADPYTGRLLVTDEAGRDVQIDHVIALSDADANGARGWPAYRKRALAVDSENLDATASRTNAIKSDRGPEEWAPDWDRCGYVVRVGRLVLKYGPTPMAGPLTVAPERLAAMRQACAR